MNELNSGSPDELPLWKGKFIGSPMAHFVVRFNHMCISDPLIIMLPHLMMKTS